MGNTPAGSIVCVQANKDTRFLQATIRRNRRPRQREGALGNEHVRSARLRGEQQLGGKIVILLAAKGSFGVFYRVLEGFAVLLPDPPYFFAAT